MAAMFNPQLVFSNYHDPKKAFGVAILPLDIEIAFRRYGHRISVLKPLEHSIGVIIPGPSSSNIATDNAAYRDRLMKLLVNCPGVEGASAFNLTGIYRSNQSGGLIEEPGWLVKAYMSREALAENLPVVLDFVSNAIEELEQESIALEINNRLFLLEKAV